MKKQPPPFVLTPDSISHDTVECLRTLLSEAERGKIIGLAYVAVLKRRSFIVNAAGEAHRNPTFARGMVAALDDEMSARMRGGL